MQELLFSVKNIFDSNSTDGCLTQYNSINYHIPAYQRGYKWGSDQNGAVSVLLDDLWKAFEAAAWQHKKEYYLQYITVKPDAQRKQLEVIDGQQRLTTLSILVSVLAALHGSENYSTGKLLYAIRQDFFTEDIYESTKLRTFISQNWEELIRAKPKYNKQDIFYLHGASRRIYNFLQDKQQLAPERLGQFAEYLAQHVKLIVNAVEPHVQSETVFKNLNSNKVPLTETELIKALIITRVGRAGAERRHFKEVMEARLGLGRLWDELTTWANTPEISTFYFNGATDGMHLLLELVASSLKDGPYNRSEKQSDKELPLFNFYNQYPNIGAVYAALKETYARLRDWYADTATYNQIGFCRFAKDSGRNDLLFLQKCLRHQTKSALQSLLLKEKQALLTMPEGISKLFYKQDEKTIHAILLALSVFKSNEEEKAIRFNFHEFKIQKWSLEHIFPQSPEGKEHILTPDQKQVVRDMLGDKVPEGITNLLNLEKRDEAQQKIYYDALQAGKFLNSIGNMCLLTGGANASNGCLFFREKRSNILRLIRQGSFVPKHTLDVFSKMLEPLDEGDLTTWTVADIEAHRQYIEQHINQIIN